MIMRGPVLALGAGTFSLALALAVPATAFACTHDDQAHASWSDRGWSNDNQSSDNESNWSGDHERSTKTVKADTTTCTCPTTTPQTASKSDNNVNWSRHTSVGRKSGEIEKHVVNVEHVDVEHVDGEHVDSDLRIVRTVAIPAVMVQPSSSFSSVSTTSNSSTTNITNITNAPATPLSPATRIVMAPTVIPSTAVSHTETSSTSSSMTTTTTNASTTTVAPVRQVAPNRLTGPAMAAVALTTTTKATHKVAAPALAPFSAPSVAGITQTAADTLSGGRFSVPGALPFTGGNHLFDMVLIGLACAGAGAFVVTRVQRTTAG